MILEIVRTDEVTIKAHLLWCIKIISSAIFVKNFTSKMSQAVIVNVEALPSVIKFFPPIEESKSETYVLLSKVTPEEPILN